MGRKAGNLKKRNKKYTGYNSKRSNNLVRIHHVNAKTQSDLMLWIREHKSLIQFSAVAGFLIVLICVGIYTLFK